MMKCIPSRCSIMLLPEFSLIYDQKQILSNQNQINEPYPNRRPDP